MSIDGILKEIGENGTYQTIVFIFMTFAKALAGIQVVVPILTGFEMKYICKDDAITFNSSVFDIFSNVSAMCNRNTSCSQWIFQHSIMTSSIMTQYFLVCEYEVLINIASSFFFCGLIIGALLSGLLADIYGRLWSFYGSALLMGVFSLTAAFAPIYELFVLLRFLTGIGVGGILSTLFTITTEIYTHSNRVFYSFCVHQGWSIGIMLFALAGYFIRNHMWLQVVSAAPNVVLIFATCFLHESPRWLIAKGHRERAMSVLNRIAKRNGKDFSNLKTNFDVIVKEKPDEALSWIQQLKILIQFRVLVKRFVCVSFSFFCCNLIFFCAYLGLDSLLGGNIFVKIAISAAVEIPSRFTAMIVAKKLGRRPNLFIAYFFTSVCFFFSAGLAGYRRFETLQIVTAMIAKFWATITLDSMWLYSAEILPTNIRNSSIGLSNLFGRIGSAVAAFIPPLRFLWFPLPYVLLGVLAFLATLVTILLPELKNAALPEMTDFAATEFVEEGERKL